MQINKVHGPSFGKCTINKSAEDIFDKLPNQKISKLFQQAYSIQDTKYWDLFITKSSYNDDAYMVHFINKQAPLLQSFIGNLFPLTQEKNKIKAVAPDANPFSDLNITYQLKFENEERASEVYRFLNQTEPQKGEDLFDREFNIIHILEESYEYMNKPKSTNSEKPSFFERILSFFQK